MPFIAGRFGQRMRAGWLALLVLGTMAAGCVAGPETDPTAEPEQARLACIDAVCNFEATVSPETRQANELGIAVNPTNPLNIIATGKDYTPEEAGDCTWSGIYATLDGGKTWKNQNVPGSPWRRLQDPTVPVTPFSKFWCATDPVVAFGPDGRAYWTVMPYQCDALSGSKTGRGVLPNGGFNDWLWTCSSMYVLVSDDGGMTWPVELAREVATGIRLAHDKQWIAVAPDNSKVLICWDYTGEGSTSPDLVPHAPNAEPASVVCSVSRDRGASWSRFEVATTAGGLPWIDFGPDGRAWMAISNGFTEGDVLVLHSDDGVRWSEPVKVAAFENGPGRNEYGWPTLEGSSFRLVPAPALAVDRSAGPHGGRVYVTYFSHEAGQGEALLAWSDDGTTWSAPVRPGPAPSGFDQFMPSVSVGPDGTVDVSWNDRRDDPQDHLFHVYYAYSLDGGATFAPALRVTDQASDERHSHHQNGMVFLGDYRDGDSTDGRAHLTWVDTRHGKADVMVATVERPGANP